MSLLMLALLSAAFQIENLETVFQAPTTVAENAQLAAVGERLRSHAVLRAQFNQEKKIKVLRRPLKSSGAFLFAADHGILWRTDKPFPSEFIITPDAIRQKSQDADPIEIQAEAHPFIHGVTSVFMSLFQGDTQALETHFDLYFQGDADHWTIGLKPKKVVMKKLIDRIVLSGDQTIRAVHFQETSGDTTLIQFTRVSHEPETLSDTERGWFGD